MPPLTIDQVGVTFAGMKHFMKTIADVLDIIAMLGALYAAWFVLSSILTIETGPEFMQIGLAGLVIAVIPYCLAGAFHRAVVRLDL